MTANPYYMADTLLAGNRHCLLDSLMHVGYIICSYKPRWGTDFYAIDRSFTSFYLHFSVIYTFKLWQLLTSLVSIMAQIIIKAIGPPKTHVKFKKIGNCFMCLTWYLDTFRKSHEVSAFKFDPFWVKTSRELNPGYYSPPWVIGLKKKETFFNISLTMEKYIHYERSCIWLY